MSSSAPRVALLLPARDEEQALPLVLADVPAGEVDLVVVCDNGSTDGTARVAREAGATVVEEPRAGYGRACLRALEHVRSEVDPPWGAQDVVCFLDADYSDYPEELPRVVGPVKRGEADFVIGSRILGGASRAALLPQAWFGNRLACFLMRVLFGVRATDLGPFRAIRFAALEELAMSDETFGWTIEMQLKAHARGLVVREVPVRYRARVGRSKITGTWSGTLRAGAKILGWIFAFRVRLWLR